ncbi:MAG: rhodanese-like domain-containing protein [Spirochaetia bacterium]
MQHIDRETLKSRLDAGEPLHVVEVLQPKEFAKGHIAGAVNIPFTKMTSEARDRFSPEDEIVVYCHDPQCQASNRAAEKLEKLGYTNVYEYAGGKEDWKAAGYPMEYDAPAAG